MNRSLIVLVDDDPDKRMLLERFLRKQFPEHKVVSVEDCAGALPLVLSPISKIVITNGRIAQEDGIEFASYVSREAHAPVVMISLREELRNKALQAGVSEFVETYDYESMREAITRALDSVASNAS